MLGIMFDHPKCCVYLVDTGGEQADRDWLMDRLERAGQQHQHIYTTEIADEEKLIVVANYDDALTSEDVQNELKSIAAARGMQLYSGTAVDSPKRLPLSFMAALTESRYGEASPQRSAVTADQLADDIIMAVESGNEKAIDSACSAVADFLSTEELNGLLTKHHIYELVSSILRKATEEGYEIEKAAINSLVLLPDTGMVINDLKKLLLAGISAEKQHKVSGDDTAKLIVEYVIANAYDPDINLQAMSDEFGLSADYISTMIKRETGSAFKEYLAMLRISEGRRLLMENRAMTVNEVALKVGYRKASNFSRKFKELMGLLPSEIR